MINTTNIETTNRLRTSTPVDVVIPFYNESGNVFLCHRNTKRLEAFFKIKNYIYINNGSRDNTLEELKELKKGCEKIQILNIQKNIGYGNGFKKGFERSTAQIILTNHADQQFDAFEFYKNIPMLNEGDSIFPIRKLRPVSSAISSLVLRQVLSVILNKKLRDFNGQPKLIQKSAIARSLDDFPNDFSFDLALYLTTPSKKFYPINERPRIAGHSSWNRGFKSKFVVFKQYITSSRSLKKLIHQ
ncbi:MAG: glycosyltransferase family 2 protein [Cytophagia bacterium]|nr:glycosyltransferase family 2 protein [Cytophagia bacterium]